MTVQEILSTNVESVSLADMEKIQNEIMSQLNFASEEDKLKLWELSNDLYRRWKLETKDYFSSLYGPRPATPKTPKFGGISNSEPNQDAESEYNWRYNN
jgi:hypothetical protein